MRFKIQNIIKEIYDLGEILSVKIPNIVYVGIFNAFRITKKLTFII